jgi:hypothetical protein
VCDDVVHHGVDALGVFHQHGHLGGALRQVVAVLLAQAPCDLLVGFVDRSLVDLEFYLRCLEMQREGGPRLRYWPIWMTKRLPPGA